MSALHSVGAAAQQRYRIREKMSTIILEHDPLAAAASTRSRTLPFASSRFATATAFGNSRSSTPIIDGERKYTSHYQVTAQSGGESTAKVAPTPTLHFPDPGSCNFIGLEGTTKTIIVDDDDSFPSGARKGTSLPSQVVAGANDNNITTRQSTTPRRSLFALPKSSRRRRHCVEETKNSSTQHVTTQHLGNIYDLQLDRRAIKSNKRQKVQNHAVPQTTRDGIGRTEEGTETTLLSPVKRRLYQNSEEEQLLTPTKVTEDNEMANKPRSTTQNPHVDHSGYSSPDEDPFASIGQILRLLEEQ